MFRYSHPNSSLHLPPGVSSHHGGMQYVLSSCVLHWLTLYPLGSTLDRCTSISRNPISNRCSSRLASWNLLIFIGTRRPVEARAMHSFSGSTILWRPFSELNYYMQRYKRSEDAKMALEQMEGFELAGRTVRFETIDIEGYNFMSFLAACQYRT